jgi:hypothetical protein
MDILQIKYKPKVSRNTSGASPFEDEESTSKEPELDDIFGSSEDAAEESVEESEEGEESDLTIGAASLEQLEEMLKLKEKEANADDMKSKAR